LVKFWELQQQQEEKRRQQPKVAAVAATVAVVQEAVEVTQKRLFQGSRILQCQTVYWNMEANAWQAYCRQN
jgi:hypothetical protein